MTAQRGDFVPAGWGARDWSQPLTARVVTDPPTARCACGRPVPGTSSCGCCCAECDDAPGELLRPEPTRYHVGEDRVCESDCPGDHEEEDQ